MLWLWIGFIAFVVLMLALDLGVFHRTAHAVSLKESLIWSAVWITLALLFTVFIYFGYRDHWLGLGIYDETLLSGRAADLLPRSGWEAAVKYLTGYVVEKTLSVDNIFVISLIFTYFRIPAKYQHRVLFWGILGAVVMRGMFIGLGAALILRFHWIIYLFGVFLLYTAYKMLTAEDDPDPAKNPLVRLAYRVFPITPELHGQRFLVRESDVRQINEPEEPPPPDVGATEDLGEPTEAPGDAVVTSVPVALTSPSPAAVVTDVKARWVLTPLALALIVVEGTDVVFAVDSIPAIFAITTDPFIVFTSNIFAVLGLRALYFALAGIIDKFHYLKISLAVVLGLIGLKMLLTDVLKQSVFLKANLPYLTLGLIVLILTAGVVASLVWADRKPIRPDEPPPA